MTPGRKHIVAGLLLPFLAALVLLTAAASSTLAPGEDVFLARSIEQYIVQRSETVRQRVDSISIKKRTGTIEGGVYRTEWDIVLRYRLGYARPDEDPFLAGMIQCLAELKSSSDTDWVEWAQNEVSAYREEIQEKMAFAQELSETICAVTEVNSAGYIDADIIKLQIAGTSEAVDTTSLLAGIPDPAVYEALGYRYLADERVGNPGGTKAASEQSTGSAGAHSQVWPVPSRPKGHTGSSAPPASVGSASASTAPALVGPTSSTSETPVSGPGASSSGGQGVQRPDTSEQAERQRLIVWVVGILGLLMAILVASEMRRNGPR